MICRMQYSNIPFLICTCVFSRFILHHLGHYSGLYGKVLCMAKYLADSGDQTYNYLIFSVIILHKNPLVALRGGKKGAKNCRNEHRYERK